ncbi:MAG: hypothetical protein WBR18_09320 [Anaerolineales bacterium]
MRYQRSPSRWRWCLVALVLTGLSCSGLSPLTGSSDDGGQSPTAVSAPSDGQATSEESEQEPASELSAVDLVTAGLSVNLVQLDGPASEVVVSPQDGYLVYGSPAVSPDGSQLAFLAGRLAADKPVGKDLFVVNIDGSNLTLLTPDAELSVESYEWSPDGRRIAFAAAPPGESYNLYAVDPASGEIAQLTEDGGWQLDWSPDGTLIAFSAFRADDYQIFTMNPDGSNQIQLTEPPGRSFRPRWSPDGTQLAFESDRDSSSQTSDIYIINADGSSRTRLTDDPFHEIQPSWSPNGARIAFLRQRIERKAAYDLVVMQPDGSGLLNLTEPILDDETVTELERAPLWLTDGTWITYSGRDYLFYMFRADGSGHESYSLGEANGEPALPPAP